MGKGCVFSRPGRLWPRWRVHATFSPGIMGKTLLTRKIQRSQRSSLPQFASIYGENVIITENPKIAREFHQIASILPQFASLYPRMFHHFISAVWWHRGCALRWTLKACESIPPSQTRCCCGGGCWIGWISKSRAFILLHAPPYCRAIWPGLEIAVIGLVFLAPKVAFSGLSVDRFGKKFWGLMILG